MDRRRRSYKNYLSDRSHENKRKVKEVEKSLKYELRRFEVEAMDEITKYLEDILYILYNLIYILYLLFIYYI